MHPPAQGPVGDETLSAATLRSDARLLEAYATMVAQQQRDANQQRNDALQRGSNLGDGSLQGVAGMTSDGLNALDANGDIIMEEVD